MSAQNDANRILDDVLNFSVFYARETFPWHLQKPVVFLCRSADSSGIKASVKSNVMAALYASLYGESHLEWTSSYLEDLESLVFTEGVFHLYEGFPGDNQKVLGELGRVFGSALPSVNPESVAVIHARLFERMIRDVAGLANAYHHSNPTYKADVMAALNGTDARARIEAATTEFLSHLGSTETVEMN